MFLESMPAVDGNLIVPPGSKLRTPAVLRFKFNSRNFLEWIFLLVPFNTNAIKRMLRVRQAPFNEHRRG